jgi:hypothetical protein
LQAAAVVARQQRLRAAPEEPKRCFYCKRLGIKSTALGERSCFCDETCYVAHCRKQGADPRRCSTEDCTGVAVPGTPAGTRCRACWLASKRVHEAAGYARRKRQRERAE